MKRVANQKIQGKVFKSIVRNEISKIGGALADPNRVGILDILSQGECNVEQITTAMKSTKGTISHHLQILKTANLVVTRKESRYVYYSMPEPALEIWHALNINSQLVSDKIICAVNSFFDQKYDVTLLDHKTDYLELQSMIQSGEIILIDVRPEREFSQGHFPGALSVPLEALREKLNEFPKEKLIIAYCRGPLCVLAEDAVNILRAEKFEAYRWKESVLDWAEKNIKIELN